MPFAMSRIVTVALGIALVTACGGGDSPGGGGNLSPARNLAGTWKTNFPVTVYIKTDWCGATTSLVASQSWAVTWVITPGADDNTVNIQMNFGTSNSKVLAGCPDTGVTPEVSPMFLTGTVSSSALTLKKGTQVVGDFTFTTDNLQGNFDYPWCAAFCQEEYTQNREFILARQ